MEQIYLVRVLRDGWIVFDWRCDTAEQAEHKQKHAFEKFPDATDVIIKRVW